jgi:ABC-type nitrate/sulfonate/bicarbonate transport system ATPase subunit
MRLLQNVARRPGASDNNADQPRSSFAGALDKVDMLGRVPELPEELVDGMGPAVGIALPVHIDPPDPLNDPPILRTLQDRPE